MTHCRGGHRGERADDLELAGGFAGEVQGAVEVAGAELVEREFEQDAGFAEAGANTISFHPEASLHVHRTIELIKSSGARAGLALNPATPLAVLDHVIERLDVVLHTIYLIFNEGYEASSGATLLRQELCAEAVRLARLLKQLHPSPDIDGLLALMLLHQSREAARTAPDGTIVLLEQQDRRKWNVALNVEGTTLAQLAFARPPLGGYTIQAMIAATHAAASTRARRP